MAIALVFTVVADGIAGDHSGQVLQVCELCVRLRVENGFPITEATSKHWASHHQFLSIKLIFNVISGLSVYIVSNVFIRLGCFR